MPGKKTAKGKAGRPFADIKPVLAEKIGEAEQKNISSGILHISIDNYPMIISSHGDVGANYTIEDVVKQISEITGKDDYVARTAQDEIHIILMDYSPMRMGEKALQIRNRIQNYGYTHSLKPIQIKTTIGGVNFIETDKSCNDTLNKAYIAVNEARKKAVHYMEYGNREKHEVKSKNQMVLASYIQNALLSSNLRLAFQPIIDRKTGEVAYYESLLRIVNEDGTTSSAGPFIPIAEKMGFIDVIDGFVLQLVVNELSNSPDVKLSVNLSHASINDPKWLEMAQELLQDKKLAVRLIVEITETAQQNSTKKTRQLINTLQKLGCQIALDDFGAGYTSFSQLKTLPVDIIKIDGSFVKDIAHNDENRFFVEKLLEFSSKFGMKTVAEFVENAEIAQILNDMGVDYMQGNYFSPAVNYRGWVGEEGF